MRRLTKILRSASICITLLTFACATPDGAGNAVTAASIETAPAAPPTPDQVNAAFERFKNLDGTWKGESTRGWTDSGTWRTIAGGSVVMHSSFDAHPGETMVTMIHPDRDRLLLTHYCVAKNQPRLVLTQIEQDGARLTFEWLDGTNLKSRDQGHMDKVVYEFRADGSFTSRWTWYQDGKENWMEEIANVRAEEPAK
jgi:hypothetical protein